MSRNTKSVNTLTEMINRDCSEYLSLGMPFGLYKDLPFCSDFKLVKLRKKKMTNKTSKVFCDVFGDIYQRAVFCNNTHTPTHYIYPLNGYMFLYNSAVQNANDMCDEIYAKNIEDILPVLIKSTYRDDDLLSGLKSKAEVLIYNTPRYYAVECWLAHENLRV